MGLKRIFIVVLLSTFLILTPQLATSALAFFDVVQLILAGALRGAANVKAVMWIRLIICGGVFVPLSYFFSQLPITNQTLKFMLIYGSLYFCNALMGALYIKRFREQEWVRQAIRNSA